MVAYSEASQVECVRAARARASVRAYLQFMRARERP